MIRDRISFMEFLGLTFADTVPDAKIIWAFSEQLKNLELEQALFDRFGEELDRRGFQAKSGHLVDGRFVEVPKVRCRIEHIFVAMKNRCRDEVLRTIGMARATFWIGLRNLAYNMSRLVSLKRRKGAK